MSVSFIDFSDYKIYSLTIKHIVFNSISTRWSLAKLVNSKNKHIHT